MGNARLLAVVAVVALFILVNLGATKNDDRRQPSVSVLPKQKNDMGRILLYITTHMSTTHFWYLNTCWPEALSHSSLLREADVLVYLTAPESVREEAVQQLNSTFYKNSNLTIHVADNPGWQEGAAAAMKDATLNNFFVGYDWIIRMNPDVIIRNDTFLVSTITNDSNATAMLVDCTPKELDRNKLTPKMRAWEGPLVQTDFFALKPSALPPDIFVKKNGNFIAEKLFTNDIREPILNKGGQRFIPNASPMTGKSCRAGDGRPMKDTPLTHIHYDEKDQTDICPIAF